MGWLVGRVPGEGKVVMSRVDGQHLELTRDEAFNLAMQLFDEVRELDSWERTEVQG